MTTCYVLWTKGENMKVICSGCGKHLGYKSIKAESEDEVSHGLCDSCAFHFRAQVGMPLEQFLEGLEIPVVTVTPDGIIGSANKLGFAFLGKSLDEIHGLRGGDVFECEYARLPGGCGETIHCSGCTIRNTVMDTVKTGAPNLKVPAFLNRYSEAGSKLIDLFITTEKIGGIVFLKIDRVEETSTETNLNKEIQ